MSKLNFISNTAIYHHFFKIDFTNIFYYEVDFNQFLFLCGGYI